MLKSIVGGLLLPVFALLTIIECAYWAALLSVSAPPPAEVQIPSAVAEALPLALPDAPEDGRLTPFVYDFAVMAFRGPRNPLPGFGAAHYATQLSSPPRRGLLRFLTSERIRRTWTSKQYVQQFYQRAYFFGGVYGLENTAARLYGLHPEALSPAQMALLLGMNQSPSRYNPQRYPGRAKLRRDFMLRKMFEDGLISAEDLRAGQAEHVCANIESCPPRTNATPAALSARP